MAEEKNKKEQGRPALAAWRFLKKRVHMKADSYGPTSTHLCINGSDNAARLYHEL